MQSQLHALSRECWTKRLEQMDYENVNAVLEFISHNLLRFLIPRAALRLNPNFKYLVEKAKSLEVEDIDRCNLTVLLEPCVRDLSSFWQTTK